MKEYGKDVYKALDKKFWEGAEIDGSIYAIPNQKEIVNMPMWVFSKEYVDKYNIPYKDIKTLDDLEPWLKLIKENEEGVIPFYVDDSYSVPMIWDQLAPALGINLESNSFEVINIFKTEEMINNLKTMRRYKELGYTNTKIGNAGDFSTKRFVTENKWDEFKEVNNNSHVSQALGFKFDTSNVTVELEAVNAVLEEFTRSLYTGLVDTDEYVSKLINKLESAGIDKVKEELEIQLNDWKIKKQTF